MKTALRRFGCLWLASLASCAPLARPNAAAPDGDWPNARGDQGARRYSPLAQIHRGNVGRMRIAWVYHTGDAGPGATTTIENTPVVVANVLYLTSADRKLVALDGTSGREIWSYDYKPTGRHAVHPLANHSTGQINRGVAYWSDGRGAARILLGTTDGRLLSIDARTGRPDAAFGEGGAVDLRRGITERDLEKIFYGLTSPPNVYQDIVILGFANGEAQATEAPGDIRAFDVRTGRELWRFRTVPLPGELGHDSWGGGSWENRGGANPWGGITVDPERGMVFAGTGSATYDYYGGDRPGQNLFANSILALDAKTGKRIWHFQTVHHDLWDYDLPHPPTLVTVRRGGREIAAVAQIAKTGFVYLLDRVTGEPIFPIEERPVSGSTVAGEHASATQPFPTNPAPIARQHAVTREEVGGITPEHDRYCKTLFDSIALSGGLFTPTGDKLTLAFPGMMGGATWSGASFDPASGYLYVNVNEIGQIGAQVPTTRPGDVAFRRQVVGTTATRFWDPNKWGCQPPPWGALNAVDLNTGRIAWRVPLGVFEELEARGIPATGTPNLGGSIVTAGGLVFIASTMDERIRAFDARDGNQLWEAKLPAAGYAAPATYLGSDGRQYLVIAAGGGGKWGTPSGDAFVAFTVE
ncbi:MAG: pyrroloquinoline quinone-dependent dehydrogenase [Gemmatimonadetes bacterium]|nr:pyrroloquinoline quinone-dependent dehydrogenase [Gemmatimonadota bacterium]